MSPPHEEDAPVLQAIDLRKHFPVRGTRARKVVHVRHDVAHAVYHHDAKSIRGMRKQIIEFMQVKHRYASKLSLSAVQRARLYTGMASLWAYYAATRLGIKRAT